MSSGGSSDNDKFNNKFGFEPPVKKSKFAQAKVSVCHVQAPPIPPDTVAPGTADLYELAEGVFTVATNNHVIPITDTNFLAPPLLSPPKAPPNIRVQETPCSLPLYSLPLSTQRGFDRLKRRSELDRVLERVRDRLVEVATAPSRDA